MWVEQLARRSEEKIIKQRFKGKKPLNKDLGKDQSCPAGMGNNEPGMKEEKVEGGWHG